jgi:hypothetical protein
MLRLYESLGLRSPTTVPKKKNPSGRANRVLLAPFDKKTAALQVIIETPKGSRNKYAFEAEPFSAKTSPDFR